MFSQPNDHVPYCCRLTSLPCQALENRASGLRINEVCPGFTDTPMLQCGIQKQPEIGNILDKSMPLGRVATPEEIAISGKSRRKLRQRAVGHGGLWTVSQYSHLSKDLVTSVTQEH
ncbi:hypothetical protein GGR51DRAFT_566313 [Nemania sp. FL0031]|nr:hypothetical protein GGR51DRAFT_566313 [Nemania sp. FL0031]